MSNALIIPTHMTLHHKLDEHSTKVVTGVTLLQQLFERYIELPMTQDPLFLAALQRSTRELENASPQEMADYLGQMNDAQLQGVATNVRGIYHELKYVDTFNNQHPALHAEVFGATNHPGSDVAITHRDSGQMVDAFQLKATDSASYVQEHVERYPDITVIATEEVANKLDNVESSGFTNVELKRSVNGGIERLEEASFSDQVGDAMGLSAFASGLIQVSQVLAGKKAVDQAVRDGLIDAGVATTSCVVVGLLLG